ncbi:PREDICTED: facilitated trehalose transporter Tret1-2 homolog [Atta colombica]|nr:PREDICTED: facilitated trehalose transporter Tret1-2 homolog [Atta colombica]
MKMNDYDISDTKFRLYLRQLLTISGQLIGICVTGMSFGYSAILLPQLKTISTNNIKSLFESVDADHFGVLSIDQESWIAASTLLPIVPGCCTGGFMAEKLGRKTSVMLIFPVYLIGWLIIGFANSIEVLIAGSFLSGYCVGVLAPIYSIYVSETSDPLLLGAGNLTLSVGILACHAMGTWLHWRTTAYICGVLPVICWIVSVYSQESPLWLLRKGKFEEAKRSWIYLRGKESLEEFSLLETIRLAEISGKKIKKRSLLQSQKKMWTSRYFLKPLSIICLYFFIMQFSGSNVMIFYCIGML